MATAKDISIVFKLGTMLGALLFFVGCLSAIPLIFFLIIYGFEYFFEGEFLLFEDYPIYSFIMFGLSFSAFLIWRYVGKEEKIA
ncbi:hypothetical protein [Glaciecola sp. 1036]|uniref:hypothetical protein n=1 Tax=Alteromonadaceae TaxID=72275 RepID=UPI003D03B4B5